MSICEERVLKYGQPGTKAILKIQKLKLKTKAKLLIVSWNQSCNLAEVHVTTVRPFFANTAVIRRSFFLFLRSKKAK